MEQTSTCFLHLKLHSERFVRALLFRDKDSKLKKKLVSQLDFIYPGGKFLVFYNTASYFAHIIPQQRRQKQNRIWDLSAKTLDLLVTCKSDQFPPLSPVLSSSCILLDIDIISESTWQLNQLIQKYTITIYQISF